MWCTPASYYFHILPVRIWFDHHGDKLFHDAVAIEPIVMLRLCAPFIFSLWYRAGARLIIYHCVRLSADIMFLIVWRCLDSDLPDPPPTPPASLRHMGGPHSAAPGPEWTGWSRRCGLACPIMSWITPSSPLQLFNCYPPFCGVKPNCVELDRRGAHWKPLAWGVFSLLRSECWHRHNFPHTRAHTKCQLRDLWGQRERRTSRQHSF